MASISPPLHQQVTLLPGAAYTPMPQSGTRTWHQRCWASAAPDVYRSKIEDSEMINTMIELQTTRLTLRTIDDSFAHQVVDYLARNRAFFEPWNPAMGEAYYTFAFQQQRLIYENHLQAEDRAIRFWLFHAQDQGFEHIIGDLAFSNIVRGAFQSCHLGYKLDRAENGGGLMTEALAAAIAYAFGTLKLHRIEANIMPRNTRSIRVVEKLGFAPEGLARRYLKINGVWEDHIHYVLLNPDE